MKRPLIPVILAGSLSTACTTHTMFHADPSRFTVTSTPPGATVYVMGEALGTTPLEIQREQVFPSHYPSQLQAEYGFVTLEHHGCKPYRKSISNKILEDDLVAKLNCAATTEPAALPVEKAPPPKPATKQRLIELKSLYDDGLITEQEYKERRQAIINDI